MGLNGRLKSLLQMLCHLDGLAVTSRSTFSFPSAKCCLAELTIDEGRIMECLTLAPSHLLRIVVRHYQPGYDKYVSRLVIF